MTGCVQWPGSQFNTCDKIWKYKQYDIVTDVDKMNDTMRRKRDVDDDDLFPLPFFAEEIDDTEEVETSEEEFSFNKSTDQVG